MLVEEADAKVWQDLPDVDTLLDADELDSILESFYEADLSNELAPHAADFNVYHVMRLKPHVCSTVCEDFFAMSHQSIVAPAALDMSLRPNSQTVSPYDAAAAEVDRLFRSSVQVVYSLTALNSFHLLY